MNMRISVLPKSLLGWLSVGLAAAFFLLFILHQTFAASVQRNPVPIPGSPSLVILITLVADYILAIGSLVTGLISVIRSKERSILVLSVVIASFIVLLFLLGEFLFPH